MSRPRRGSISELLRAAVRSAFGARPPRKSRPAPARRKRARPARRSVTCTVCGDVGHNARRHKPGETDFLGTIKKARKQLKAAGVVVDATTWSPPAGVVHLMDAPDQGEGLARCGAERGDSLKITGVVDAVTCVKCLRLMVDDKKAGRQGFLATVGAVTPKNKPGGGEDDRLRKASELVGLEEFLPRLTNTRRAIVESILGGKTAAQIAVETAITLGGVHWRFAKALSELRRIRHRSQAREFDQRPPLPPAPSSPAPAPLAPPGPDSRNSEVDHVTTMSDVGADGRASATIGSGTVDGAGAAMASEPDASNASADDAPRAYRRDLAPRLEELRPWFVLLGPKSRELVELRAGGMSTAAIAEQLQRNPNGIGAMLFDARCVLERHRKRLDGQAPGPDYNPRRPRVREASTAAAPKVAAAADDEPAPRPPAPGRVSKVLRGDRLIAHLVALRPWFVAAPARAREVLGLRADGLAAEAIGARLGCAGVTVDNVVRDGRMKAEQLREQLAGVEPPPDYHPPAATRIGRPRSASPSPRPAPAPLPPLPTEWEAPVDPTGRRPGEIDPDEDFSEFFPDDHAPAAVEPETAAPEVSIVPPPDVEGELFDVPAVALVRRRREAAAAGERVRSGTIPLPDHLTREEIRVGELIEYPDDVERPRRRGDCTDMPRPCPFVSCHHHLYLDVNEDSGSIRLNFPHLEVWQMTESCALDVADRGEATLEAVGKLLNVTRERVRQIEAHAFKSRAARREAAKIELPEGEHLSPLAAIQSAG